MWNCKKCKRPFKTRNQWHSCVTVNPYSVFEKSIVAANLYKVLEKKVKEFGNDVVMSAAKSAVFAKANGTFAAFKRKKTACRLNFFYLKK